MTEESKLPDPPRVFSYIYDLCGLDDMPTSVVAVVVCLIVLDVFMLVLIASYCGAWLLVSL